MARCRSVKHKYICVATPSMKTKSPILDMYHIINNGCVKQDFKCFEKVRSKKMVMLWFLDMFRFDAAIAATVRHLKRTVKE